jgi:hypothetical protein
VLALVFMVVIALMLVAVVQFSGNDLLNTSNLLKEQALEYGAEGGANVAIQTVRYSNDTYSYTNPGPCFSGNSAITTGSHAPGVYVSCESVATTNTGVSREISFYVCLSQSGCSVTNYVVSATVDFVDGTTCSTGSISACGATESIKSWLVHNANN